MSPVSDSIRATEVTYPVRVVVLFARPQVLGSRRASTSGCPGVFSWRTIL